MSKMVKAHIETGSDEPYRLEWLSEDKEFSNYKPNLDSINFYDEKTEEDIEIIPSGKSIKFSINPVKNEENNFDITFSGSIEFNIEETQYKILEGRDFSIDYVLEFENEDGDVADGDDDFEFIENQNIKLKIKGVWFSEKLRDVFY